MMNVLNPEKKLDFIIPNIAAMLKQNAENFGDKIVIQEKHNGSYSPVLWKSFFDQIKNIAFNLREFNFKSGDKIVICSHNRIEMLLLELAVMASDGIAVPIFFNYNGETIKSLIEHSDAKFFAAGGNLQLEKLNNDLPVEYIFVFDKTMDYRFNNLISFEELTKPINDSNFNLNLNANPDDICLNMYTSGTMGKQKCVQLTHQNILSQQAALKLLWNIDSNDRFLSYLRWHHSFGGIFEIFNALCNGASLSLESSHGLNPVEIFENWKIIQPTVFFSVPVVYQAIFNLIKEDKNFENVFFHPELKFVFTAAAPLPKHISDEFEKRNIPVIEGWGLTETSPCCTLTSPNLKRESGVVGLPIPGVNIRLAEDGEIQVNGFNVMKGYYKNYEMNKQIFTDDGWFCTGDIGEITDAGLKLITRKDRIFKLLNAEKVIPTELEGKITGKCKFISYALVEGSGKNFPVALLFPNKPLLERANESIEIDDCQCPIKIEELSKCLEGCIQNINLSLKQKFSRIKFAMLIDDTLSVENKTLTPSLKIAPNNVKEVYKAHIEILYCLAKPFSEDVFVINLDEEKIS